MRQPASNHAQGQVHSIAVRSQALEGNPVGDATERRVDVYLPAGHSGEGLPLLVDLVGYGAGGPIHTGWTPFLENVPERLDRLIGAASMPPVAVAFPDCYTRLGGNQYINSEAVGRWSDFLVGEMVPAIERQHGCGGRGRRGVFGKSSGGFGALAQAMLHPDVWSAAASHSGDAGFDTMALPQMPLVLRVLAEHDCSIEKFKEAFERKQKHSPDELNAICWLGVAAFFDPAPGEPAGVRLPVDLETCELIEERWRNWQAWDPVNRVAQHADALRSLKALYVDCGTRDQYNLIYGARRLHRALDRLGVAHAYEEFEDNHSGIDYRMDRSLPLLARALEGG